MRPLSGIRIVEIAAMGPVPWCGMVLAGMGAEVIRIDRAEAGTSRARRAPKFEVTDRGRRSIAVDLKSPHGVKAVLTLVSRADAVMEGMRPGVVERLGIGPRECLRANPGIVFGRMTGWGQDGPLALRAGHDINYIALSGALHAIGAKGGPPFPPLNLVGDYGGGGAFLAAGLLAALLKAKTTKQGQVVDVAMIDGVANLMALPFGRFAAGEWRDTRGENLLDGGMPWYAVYETADGRYVAVGAIEEPFYQAFVQGLGIDASSLPDRSDRERWPALRSCFAQAFRTRSRDDWERVFESKDACVTPVLSLSEVPHHPHHRARGTFVEIDGVVQPAAAPRFPDTDGSASAAQPRDGSLRAVLDRWGCSAAEIETILAGQPGEDGA